MGLERERAQPAGVGRWASWLAAVLMLAAGPVGAETAPIRVGFICPFTGGSQDFGNAARLGAELAAQEINEAGGYMGRPLELVTHDDKASPDEGRKIAEELVVQRKADFTIGYCNTGVALNALEVFQQHKHLLMVAVATGTQITARYPAGESFVFHLSPRDSLQVAFLVQELVKKGWTRIAVFADKTGYGEGGLDRKSTRLNSSHIPLSRMPSSA